jgi:hypothetical protein
VVEPTCAFLFVVGFAFFPVWFVPGTEAKGLIGELARIQGGFLAIEGKKCFHFGIADELAAVIFPAFSFVFCPLRKFCSIGNDLFGWLLGTGD